MWSLVKLNVWINCMLYLRWWVGGVQNIYDCAYACVGTFTSYILHTANVFVRHSVYIYSFFLSNFRYSFGNKRIKDLSAKASKMLYSDSYLQLNLKRQGKTNYRFILRFLPHKLIFQKTVTVWEILFNYLCATWILRGCSKSPMIIVL